MIRPELTRIAGRIRQHDVGLPLDLAAVLLLPDAEQRRETPMGVPRLAESARRLADQTANERRLVCQGGMRGAD